MLPLRIWDIDAGFLNDRSLLGEHRELHGIVSIIRNGKTGYSRHPETLRWVSHLKSLIVRHDLLVVEMNLRGFNHYSPVNDEKGTVNWPTVFIDEPGAQYEILRRKYLEKPCGRIPLPHNVQQLWASHKYSVMARSPGACKEIGSEVAGGGLSFYELSGKLVQLLRTPPSAGKIENALHHMWGYVSDFSNVNPQEKDSGQLLQEIVRLSKAHQVKYLLHSTALAELAYWCKDKKL